MSNMTEYAKDELRIAGMYDGEEYNKMVADAVVEIVAKFADQGHSGFSASMVSSILDKVLRFEPLTPLTGEDSEWNVLDYDDHMAAQNKRCSHVFKRKDGTAYDADAIVFRDPDGACFTSSESRKDITFPYVPKREYVDRPSA